MADFLDSNPAYKIYGEIAPSENQGRAFNKRTGHACDT